MAGKAGFDKLVGKKQTSTTNRGLGDLGGLLKIIKKIEPGKYYHLYTHANGSENLFRNDENFRYFLKRYEDFIPYVADTLAWCLMPNHLHLLVRVNSEEEIIKANLRNPSVRQQKDLGGLSAIEKRISKQFGNLFNRPQTSEVSTRPDLGGLNIIEKRISKQFGNLFNSYTKSYNKMYGRMGSLFIPNFKRKEINSDSYFTSINVILHD